MIERARARRRQWIPIEFRVVTSLAPALGTGTLREARLQLQGITDLVTGGTIEAPSPTTPIVAPAFLRTIDLPRGSVVLVPNPIRTRLLHTVVGWSDPRRLLAVVSASGFDPESSDTPGRLGRLVSHEVGHLLGLRHCTSEHCVARAIHHPGELDRLSGFCERCRGRLR